MEEKKGRRRAGKKKTASKITELLTTAREELELYEKSGIQLPDDVWLEFEQIEEEVESGNYSETGTKIAALLDRARGIKEEEEEALRTQVKSCIDFLNKHGIRNENCEKVISLLDSGQFGAANDAWDGIKTDVENTITNLKDALMQVKKTKEFVDYLSTHRINVDEEHALLADAENLLLHGDASHCLAQLADINNRCEQKLRRKFEEELRNITTMEKILPEITKLTESARQEFENKNYYSAFGLIANAWNTVNRADVNRLKSQINDLKLLFNEIKTLAGYMPHLEDCEKALEKRNIEECLKTLAYLKNEVEPVFERDFGRIMNKVQMLHQLLAEHGTPEKIVADKNAEISAYRNSGDMGKCMITARLLLEELEKHATEITKNIIKSLKDLSKAVPIEGINLNQKIKKVENTISEGNVYDALKTVFELKNEVDSRIRNQIEPLENAILDIEHLIYDMESTGVNVSEQKTLLMKTRSLLDNYKFDLARQSLTELIASTRKLVKAHVDTNLNSLAKLNISGIQELENMIGEVRDCMEHDDFSGAWSKLKEVIVRAHEISQHRTQDILTQLNRVVEDFSKIGIKFSMPEINHSDPLAQEKIENFIRVCEDTVREVAGEKIGVARNVLENAEKMKLGVEINRDLLESLEKKMHESMFNSECAELIGKLNEQLSMAESILSEKAMKTIQEMDTLKDTILKIGLNTEKYDVKLRLAHERIEKKKFYEAWFVANRVTTEMDRDMFEKFSNELEYTKNMVKEFAKLDSETISVKVELENARIELMRKNYLKLHELLNKVQIDIGEFMLGRVKEELANLREYVEHCVSAGVLPEEYKSIFMHLQNMITEKKIFDAHLQIKEAHAFVTNSIKNAYENIKSEIKHLAEFADKIGAEKVAVNLTDIDTVFNEDALAGLEQIVRTREHLREKLKHTINEVISSIKRQLEIFREKGIACESQSMMINDAAKLLEANKLEESYALALETKLSLATILEHVIITKLEEMRPDIDLLKRFGGYTHEIDAKITSINELLTQKDIAKAYALYFSLKNEVEGLLSKNLGEFVKHEQARIEEFERWGYNLTVEKSALEDVLKKAGEGRIKEGYEGLEIVDNQIIEKVRADLNQKLEYAKANMPIVEREMLDPGRYSGLIQKAEEYIASAQMQDAIKVIYEFESVYTPLTEKYLEKIDKLRKTHQVIMEAGIDVPNISNELESFENAIVARRFWEITQGIIEWEIYLGGVLKDRFLWEISTFEKAHEQLEKFGIKDEVGSNLIKQARALLEEGRYDEVKYNIIKARGILNEQSRALFDKEYTQLTSEIDACNGVGMDTTQAQRFLDNFRTEVSAMNFYAAKWNLENAKEALKRTEEEFARMALHTLSTNIEAYGTIFGDEYVKYEKILKQALELLRDGKYIECARLAYKTNFEFATNVSEKIRSAIEYTRKLIYEFTEKGVELDTAVALLNESITYFNSSDFITALQKANESRKIAEDYIRVYIQQRFGEVVNVVRDCTTIGMDMTKIEEQITTAEKLFEQQKYSEALFTLNGAHMDAVTRAQNEIASKIGAIEKLAHDFITNGIGIPNEVYIFIERAKYALSYGYFVQASEDVENARKYLLDILGNIAAERILAVKKIGDTGLSIGCPMKNTLKEYQELCDAITRIDVTTAIDLSRRIEADAWKELDAYIQGNIHDINVLIQIAEDYKIPHSTIDDAVSQAEMHVSWRNYTVAHQMLTNAKKVIVELIRSTQESKLESLKTAFENLKEIIKIDFDAAMIETCANHINKLEFAEAHTQLKNMEGMLSSLNTEREKELRAFVETNLKYARENTEKLTKLGMDTDSLRELLGKTMERIQEKDYVNAGIKINTLLKHLQKSVETHYVNVRVGLEQRLKIAKNMELDVRTVEGTYIELTSKSLNLDEKIEAIEKIQAISAEIDAMGTAWIEERVNVYLESHRNLNEEQRLKLDNVRKHIQYKNIVEGYEALKTLK